MPSNLTELQAAEVMTNLDAHYLQSFSTIMSLVITHYNDEAELGRQVKQVIHLQRERRESFEKNQQEQEWWHQQDQDEQFIAENGGEQ